MASHHRHLHSPWKRATASFLLVFVVLIVGTIGFRTIEHLSLVDSFYVTSMIATAQGPSQAPHTSAGKIFAATMAFISVGTVVASLGFLFGPFFGQLWRIGHDKAEEEMRQMKEKRKGA